MKRWSIYTAAATVLLGTVVLFACAQGGGRSDAGWITLIDGEKGLENFTRVGDANWRAEGGAIVADKGTWHSFLVTKRAFRDFELRAEFWATSTTNSGILVRCQDASKITPMNSYEANIFDTAPMPEFGTGSIVQFAKVKPIYKAGGRWNTYVLTARGGTVTLELNGIQTVKLHDTKFASGPIALQWGVLPKDVPGGPIKWRKVQVRPL